MNPRDLLSSDLRLRWSTTTDSLEVMHPDAERFPDPLVRIRSATLAAMSFDGASKFIGETVVLLVPELRDRYVDPLSGERTDAAGA